MIRFYAIMCPQCGTWRNCMIQEITTYRFRCFLRCRFSRKLHDAQYGGLTLHAKGPYYSEMACTLAVAKLNEERGARA